MLVRSTSNQSSTLPACSFVLRFFPPFTLQQTTKFETMVQSNFKTFVDILNVVQITICVTDWVENIVGKGIKNCYQQSLLFPQCFLKGSLPGLLKIGTVIKASFPGLFKIGTVLKELTEKFQLCQTVTWLSSNTFILDIWSLK